MGSVEYTARNDALYAAYRDGQTLTALAQTYGLHPRRVHQLLERRGRRLWAEVPETERVPRWWCEPVGGCVVAVARPTRIATATGIRRITAWRPCRLAPAPGASCCVTHGGPAVPPPPSAAARRLARLQARLARVSAEREQLVTRIAALEAEANRPRAAGG